MQDSKPLCTDEEYAKKSKYRSIVALATMLLTWTMPPLWRPRQEPPHRLTMTGKVVKEYTEGDQHLANVEYDFTVLAGTYLQWNRNHCSACPRVPIDLIT